MYKRDSNGKVIWDESSRFTLEEEMILKDCPDMLGILILYGDRGCETKLMETNKKLLHNLLTKKL